jgi:uncharacterized protein YdaL
MRPRRALGLLIAAVLTVTTVAVVPAARAVEPRAATGTLVLYDTTGQWGWLGEIYAQMSMNLASRFGSRTAKPVSDYRAGEMREYAAVVYVGSTFDEPLPDAFLDDVLDEAAPVFWAGSNVWELQARAGERQGSGAFARQYGWEYGGLDTAAYAEVVYKGRTVDRDVTNASGLVRIVVTDPALATVLATARTSTGLSTPWAVRSSGLTYVAEVPYSYLHENDRYLVWADLFFDLLAPQTAERHRALIRLEDVSPASDPVRLRQLADVLHKRKIPFSVGVIPVWTDPNGGGEGVPVTLTFADRPEVVSALKYMQRRGGTVIAHGYTHQYSDVPNPFNGRSGTDYEFYRVTMDANGNTVYVGPVPGDSRSWAGKRMDASVRALAKAGLGRVRIWEFPHYVASPASYQAAASRFAARYERALLFSGSLAGGRVNTDRYQEQFFPYEVVDGYGTRVIPENLDHPELGADGTENIVPVSVVLDRADANLVVRDGFASAFFHSFYPPKKLAELVDGLRRLGYTFVSPGQVLRDWPAALR